MTSTRVMVLTLGPILMVTACFVIAAPARTDTNSLNVVTEEPESADDERTLAEQCDAVATELRTQLPAHWIVSSLEPFILSGNLSQQELDFSFRETILPTVRALQRQYFHTPITRPITIILCSSDAVFRQCNLSLDQNERNEYSGIYSRRDRRLIVNISTGDGTLAHELTHALAHADFPKLPEWLDEGLASLFEECEFSLDGSRLIGLENWRVQAARDAIQRGELRLIQDVASTRFATRDRANVDYAYARSFCLYLQERGLIEEYYRLYHDNATSDPTGLRTLCLLTGGSTPQDIEDGFRGWLMQRSR